MSSSASLRASLAASTSLSAFLVYLTFNALVAVFGLEFFLITFCSYSSSFSISFCFLVASLTKSNFSNFDSYPDESIIQLATLATKDDIFIIFPKYFTYYPLFAKYQDIEEKYFSSIRALVNTTDARVWSFYGGNNITEDENNFIDNGWHFKPHVSNIIFQEVLGDNPKDLNNQNGFLLTKENLENYLSSITKDKS